MMTHLEIQLKCKGDPLTALSQAKRIAEAIKEMVIVYFNDNISIAVKETSDVVDLGVIYQLENKAIALQKRLDEQSEKQP